MHEVDLPAVERKWQQRWRESRAHEATPEPGRPKFFATYPYSYMNSFAHVGHGFTMLRSDLFARYHRMKGHNVLYPFAFHVTGTPIVAAANRVRDGDEAQLKILRDQGIPEDQIGRFSDPVEWVRFFPPEWRTDVDRLGLHVDWRREFITTDLNPQYDAFIRWQFGKLAERHRVAKGRHPIIWCPKDNAPVADHDRYSGEGETPQEWTLYKMRLTTPAAVRVSGDAAAPLSGDVFLVAATLRPDTVFGQTNVWIDAEHGYAAVRKGAETWILNAKSARDLRHQFADLAEWDEGKATVHGRDLVGQNVIAPGTGAAVPVLPASFIRHDKGTGIVTSVPSDSPQDLLSLRAAQAQGLATGVAPIPVIRTEKYGTDSAAKAVEETGARDDRDAERIAAATEKAYQAGFYEGVMLDNAGAFAGMKVADAKEKIKAFLVERGEAIVAHWPSGPVVCRCLTPSVVKIVTDQWFVKYGDPQWKAETHDAMSKMSFYPPLVRKQFEYVVDWLHDWACTRELGLGSRLPQDPRWLIESLSDSTIYMAYYTIAHLVEKGGLTGPEARDGVDPGELTDAFFDHVFLGKGKAPSKLAEEARREFTYWYPLDFRNSGKDLVQNHLTFMVFNHTAVWDDPKMWPRAIGVNGWVMVDGEKMSKSRGNFITLRQALDAYGASATRFALAFAGEGVDDANFDRDIAHKASRQLPAHVEHVQTLAAAPARTGPLTTVDRWLLSTMDRIVTSARQDMDATNFRSALKAAFHDMQREWAWYQRRCAGEAHAEARDRFLRVQNALLTPFVPAVACEVHERLAWPGDPLDTPYPEQQGALDPQVEEAETFVRNLLDDIRNILKVTKIEPKRIVLTTPPEWKRTFHRMAIQLAREKQLVVPNLMKLAMADPDVKAKGVKEAPKMALDAQKAYANLGAAELDARAIELDETRILQESAPFLRTEFGCEIVVQNADDPTLQGPPEKVRFAQPRKPAVFVE